MALVALRRAYAHAGTHQGRGKTSHLHYPGTACAWAAYLTRPRLHVASLRYPAVASVERRLLVLSALPDMAYLRAVESAQSRGHRTALRPACQRSPYRPPALYRRC